MRGIANELLSDGIFQALAKFIQQSTMVMSMMFLKSKYCKQEIELADTLLDCEQSLSFPSLFRVIERMSCERTILTKFRTRRISGTKTNYS